MKNEGHEYYADPKKALSDAAMSVDMEFTFSTKVQADAYRKRLYRAREKHIADITKIAPEELERIESEMHALVIEVRQSEKGTWVLRIVNTRASSPILNVSVTPIPEFAVEARGG